MYNIDALKTVIAPLVGIRETQNLRGLAPVFTAPTSGIFTDDIHSLLNAENLYACTKEIEPPAIVTDWVEGTYSVGDYVRDPITQYAYKVLASDVSSDVRPALDLARYRLYFSEVMEQKFKASANKLVEGLVAKKKLTRSSKTLLQNSDLYAGVGRRTNTVTKVEGRFVGFALKAKRGRDTIIKIDKLGLDLTAPVTDLPFYVFHSSQQEPIQTLSITTTRSNSFSWVSLSASDVIYLRNYDLNYDRHGFFIMGYYEDDLVGAQAIKKDINLTNTPCGSCDPLNTSLFKNRQPFIEVKALSKTDLDNADPSLWDVGTSSLHYDTNWGLNANITVMCDITQILLENVEVFKRAFQVQLKKDLLELIAFSIEPTVVKNSSVQLARAALYGDPQNPAVKPVTTELEEALDELDFDFSDMQSGCLPCKSSKFAIQLKTI